MKHYDVDSYCNLTEKKASSVRSKLFSSDSERKKIEKSGVLSKEEEENQLLLNRKNAMKSLKNLNSNVKSPEKEEETQKIKRSASQHARLRPLEQSPVAKLDQDKQSADKNRKNKQSLS